MWAHRPEASPIVCSTAALRTCSPSTSAGGSWRGRCATTTVAPSLLALTSADAEFVLLVKPQFEAGRARLGKGGIVRDAVVHDAVLNEVIDDLGVRGLAVHGLVTSPLRGADGNIEFFARARRGGPAIDAAEIARVVADAHGVAA